MDIVYLVGQISSLEKETYLWRKRVRDEIESEEIIVIDPCSTNFNKQILKEKSSAYYKTERSFGIDILPSKDLTNVIKSNICIANLNQYDVNKPLIGSFFELAWYFMYPEKTVIGFCNDLTSYQCMHPFVQKAVNMWCNDEIEACYLVEKFFIKKESV